METVKEQTHLIIDIEGRDLLSVFMHGMKGLYSRKITWNELMPVVEKIENGLGEKYAVDVSNNIYHHKVEYQTNIYNCGNTIAFILTTETTRLQSTYTAVVAFIKWYNQNKQS